MELFSHVRFKWKLCLLVWLYSYVSPYNSHKDHFHQVYMFIGLYVHTYVPLQCNFFRGISLHWPSDHMISSRLLIGQPFFPTPPTYLPTYPTLPILKDFCVNLSGRGSPGWIRKFLNIINIIYKKWISQQRVGWEWIRFLL